MKKRVMSFLLALALVCTMLPHLALNVKAVSDVYTWITDRSRVDGSNYTKSSSLALKLNQIFDGNASIYSDWSCTNLVNTRLGTSNVKDDNIEKYVGPCGGGPINSGTSCWIYANGVYYTLFGECTGSGTAGANSESLNISSTASVTASYNNFKAWGVRQGVGALIRANGHSMIVLSYDQDYLTILDGNGNGAGLVSIRVRSWDQVDFSVSYIIQPKESYYNELYPTCNHSYNNVGYCSECKTDYNWRATFKPDEAGIYKVSLSGGVYLRTDKPYSASTAKSALIKEGTKVEVLGSVMNCWDKKWYKVSYDGVVGYTNEDNLTWYSHADRLPVATCDEVVGVEGGVKISGWAFDPDTPGESLAIHVYVDGDNFAGACTANLHRPDVHNAHGCGEYHGFSATIPYKVSTTGTHSVVVFAINSTYGKNAKGMGPFSVTISTHSHNYTARVTKEPCCGYTGVKTYTCSCGDSYTETIAATGDHSWGAWGVTKEAACTAEGAKKHKCYVCGGEETVSIPKIGHAYESGYCKHCGAEDPNKRYVTVTFDEGGHLEYVTVEEGHTVQMPTYIPSWIGHNFTGWYSSVDGLLHQPGENVWVDEDTVFTANWEYADTTLQDSPTATVRIKYPGEGCYLEVRPTYRNMYLFHGMSPNIDTYAILYDAYGNVLGRNDDGGEDLQFWLENILQEGETYYLYVKSYSTDFVGDISVRMEPMSCLVYFDSNYDIPAVDTSPYFAGFGMQPYPDPVREGYTFLGWSTYPDAKEPEILRGDPIYHEDFRTKDEVVLYAVWRNDNAGTCGDNLAWTFDNGTLTISGTGVMTSYASEVTPWNHHREAITKIDIWPGVTSIGDWAFFNCRNLVSLVMPETVTAIGDYAFYNCRSVKNIVIGGHVKTIGAGAFGECSGMETLTIGDSVTTIGGLAFQRCVNLRTVTMGKKVASIGFGAFADCTNLKDVHYAYTRKQWDAIEMSGENDCLLEATLHCALAVAITKQPTNVTVASNAQAKTTVTATGDGLSYVWYFKDVGGTVYSKSSTTTNTYSTTMNSWRSGRQVYCVVTDQYGNSVKSDVVTLYMGNPAKITAQPKNAVAANNTKVTTSLTATGDGLKYAWYYKNAGATTWSKSSLTGNAYYVTMKSTTKGRQVYCVVTDKYGTSVKSNVVTLYMGNPAKITVQPKNGYAANGAQVKTTLTATGDGLKYAWYFRNAGATTWSKSSLTGNSYYVTMKAATKGRQVYCLVTDKYGTSVKSNVVTLHMGNPAKITTQPGNGAAPNGQKVTVSLTATGDGLKYAWYFRNAGATAWSKSSLTGNSYYVTMKSTTKGRQVYCVVTDKYGNSVKSDAVTLYMGNPAKITTQPKSVTVANGKQAKTTIKATGDGLTYTWYFRNAGTTTWSKSSLTGNSYYVTMKAATKGRQVYCVVTDKYGNSVKSNVVTLNMK